VTCVRVYQKTGGEMSLGARPRRAWSHLDFESTPMCRRLVETVGVLVDPRLTGCTSHRHTNYFSYERDVRQYRGFLCLWPPRCHRRGASKKIASPFIDLSMGKSRRIGRWGNRRTITVPHAGSENNKNCRDTLLDRGTLFFQASVLSCLRGKINEGRTCSKPGGLLFPAGGKAVQLFKKVLQFIGFRVDSFLKSVLTPDLAGSPEPKPRTGGFRTKQIRKCSFLLAAACFWSSTSQAAAAYSAAACCRSAAATCRSAAAACLSAIAACR
jgi:hypothetical protein